MGRTMAPGSDNRAQSPIDTVFGDANGPVGGMKRSF